MFACALNRCSPRSQFARSLLERGSGLLALLSLPLIVRGEVALSPAGGAAAILPEESPLQMDPLQVRVGGEADAFDQTGMGSMDSELREPPFSNDLLAGALEQDEASGNIDVELGHIQAPTPADLSVGMSRGDVRGFPMPRLRNGFSQSGIPETLGVERTERILGALVPVSGRAAPGGISNLVTLRPKSNASGSLSLSLSSLDATRVVFDASQPLVKKQLWARSNLVWYEKQGPELFTFQRQRNLSQSLTWRRSRATSLMLQLDFADACSNPSGGIPEYRLSRADRIRGPWLPLAEFHSNGPLSVQTKEVASLALQAESQLSPQLSLRASLQVFERQFSEDRFTRGEYLLDERVFSGTREPIHSLQPHRALAAGLELTWRLHGFGAEHKLSVAVEAVESVADRVQRALDSQLRSALLPSPVLRLDPESPGYWRPSYDEGIYSRVLTDRSENTSFISLRASDRTAVWQGRLVASIGLRMDSIRLGIKDRRAGSQQPRVTDLTSQASWHAALNGVLKPGRLLVFAGSSTAFEPSLRVDSRTGRIQGNETTFGYEAGVTGLALNRRLALTGTLYTCFNRNIARRNPLFGNPLYDAEHTQPQLVAAGEERFRGGSVELRWSPAPLCSLTAQAMRTHAITTASPDLPEEIGRQLSRLPVDSASLSSRLAPGGAFKGVSLMVSATYVGAYVANYESTTRHYLSYPGYTVLATSLGYRLQRGKLSHSVSLSVRNLLDEDLLQLQARVGQGRETTGGYTLAF